MAGVSSGKPLLFVSLRGMKRKKHEGVSTCTCQSQVCLMNKAAKHLRKSGGHAGTDPVKTGKYVTLKLVALELQTFQFLQISKGLGDETCDEKGKKIGESQFAVRDPKRPKNYLKVRCFGVVTTSNSPGFPRTRG